MKIVLYLILFISTPLFSQKSTEVYIEKWREECISQMQQHGIPASITMAQGILESGSGTSDLANQANNHFGIKCGSEWEGKRFFKDDDRKNECFRVYTNAKASFEDHSLFLKKSRYAALFELPVTDYKGWAHGLKKCGYATNPKYPQLLIELIEKHQLHELDKGNQALTQDIKKKIADLSSLETIE
jgi:flagellum-specific peptidoglycan hydrolase FlgJ